MVDWSKFKAFEDYKIYTAQEISSVLDWLENIVEKEENACFSQHILLFQNALRNLL